MSNVFNPRSSLFKSPFGAAICGSAVSLTCRPLSVEAFTHCSVIISHEFSGRHQEIELAFISIQDDRACFSHTFTAPDEPDLLWYYFRFWRDDGTGCFFDKSGYRSQGDPIPWQLTVYRESHTPQWFGAGVTYQIFPDRYCRLALPDPAGLVGDRWVHESWSDQPAWQAENGEIKNRDFFGGSLSGITAHLDDLAAMGVSTLYLCPIFESASNHRYNTADYTKIDPMLGGEEDFRLLCAQAKKRGMRVILDGVFNHTGSQSVYFNADGFYPTIGAVQSQESPCYDWYSFSSWPDQYESWWGIYTLPNVREDNPSYVNYMIESEDSIVRRWLRAGASGWRLDVADELPDSFIEKLRVAVEETDPEAMVIGEVWEDASNKISYSQRRRYLLGRELHGVMNYPFRTALLAYLLGGPAENFQEAMETLRENYPPAAFYSAMNFLGTHDTPRILTVLSGVPLPGGRAEQAAFRLSPEARFLGLARVRLAAAVLFTFPGSPTVYYGDEAGMEGCGDPFNRGSYPWGREDATMLDWFTCLGKLRQKRLSLQRGGLIWRRTEGALLVYSREIPGETTLTAVNGGAEPLEINLPIPYRNLISERELPAGPVILPPYSAYILGFDRDEGPECFT